MSGPVTLHYRLKPEFFSWFLGAWFIEKQFSKNSCAFCSLGTWWIFLPAAPECRNTSLARCYQECLHVSKVFRLLRDLLLLLMGTSFRWQDRTAAVDHSQVTFCFLEVKTVEHCSKNYWKLACSGCKHTGSKALRFKFAEDSQNVVHLFQQQTLRKKIMCNFFLIQEKYLYFKDMKGLWVSI